MASELSRLIEDELKNRGYNVDDDDKAKKAKKQSAKKEKTPDIEEAQPLVGGTLGIESRSTPKTSEPFFTVKRVVAVAATLFVILLLCIVLTLKAKDPDYQGTSGPHPIQGLSPGLSTKPPGSGGSAPSGMSDVKEAEQWEDDDHPDRGTEDYEDGEDGAGGSPTAGTLASPSTSPPSASPDSSAHNAPPVGVMLPPSPPVKPEDKFADDTLPVEVTDGTGGEDSTDDAP